MGNVVLEGFPDAFKRKGEGKIKEQKLNLGNKKGQAVANCGSKGQGCLLMSCSGPQGRAGLSRCRISVPHIQI